MAVGYWFWHCNIWINAAPRWSHSFRCWEIKNYSEQCENGILFFCLSLVMDHKFEICFIFNNLLQLQRHFQAETLPWIERMRVKEQSLQRRLLRVGTVLYKSQYLPECLYYCFKHEISFHFPALPPSCLFPFSFPWLGWSVQFPSINVDLAASARRLYHFMWIGCELSSRLVSMTFIVLICL